MGSYVSDQAAADEDPRAVFLALIADVEIEPYNCSEVVEYKADWIARFDAAMRRAIDDAGLRAVSAEETG